MVAEGDFNGAKAALILDGHVVTLLRDDKPGLPFAAMWDLPGGGREAGETPEECVLREIREETFLRLGANALSWRRRFRDADGRDLDGYFFAGRIDAATWATARLGDEGQALCLMPVGAFLRHARAVPKLKRALAEAWIAL